jgi:uncharacterized protein
VDVRDKSLSAVAVRDALALKPHPEGGHYREVWRDEPKIGGRGAASSILFLLGAGERSRWHRVDAAEIWLWQAGSPLHLGIAPPGLPHQSHRLGPNIGEGETLQLAVPAGAWQEAETLGPWTLVACVVAPAFEFKGFELAPAHWYPGSTERS